MFSFQELAIASDVDLSRISPEASDFDQKLEMANQLVRKWMKDPDNRQYLDEKKADYLHGQGWSRGSKGCKGNLKHEVDIPSDAFMLLPREIRNDRKELMKWVEKYHPYLMHKKIV
jgi:hypothetical protein